jgi:transposase
MTPEEENVALRAENAALRVQVSELPVLREQVTVLLARVQELEAQRAKDSHNSSKPPSSDGLRRKTKSLRKPSGKKAGGQLGHRGQTLHLVATPDVVVEHRPAVCAQCQTALEDAPVVLRERRQVSELPPVRLVVTEHRALHVRCAECGQVSVGAFPTAAPSRAQYGPRLRALAVYLVQEQLVPLGRVQQVLADLFGIHLARGTLVAWVQQAARALAPVEEQIKRALRSVPVLHSDETGVRRAGRLAWVHVASTPRLTHYAVHAKRGAEATTAIGILPDYTGVSVHDGWKPYRAQTRCRHALCNIHHLRELTFLEEQFQQAWAKELKDLLRAMHAAAAHTRAQGRDRLPAAQREPLLARYQALLAAGLAANPPPARQRGHRGRVKQSPARNLLERLYLHQEQVLAFLDDLTIPFDNNQAERDLRGLKLHQKVSGCFRSDLGAEAFMRLRGYLSCMRKQGRALLAALQAVFAAQPLYPEFAWPATKGAVKHTRHSVFPGVKENQT